MRVELRDKKKNPDYNNLIHIPESKWKWTINATTNRLINPQELLSKKSGFVKELVSFRDMIVNNGNDSQVIGFCVAEIQHLGGRLHFHSVWSDLPNISGVITSFNNHTGPSKRFNNSKIEMYLPRCITDKDYIWYIVKDPVGVYYTSKLTEEIVWNKEKVVSLEKSLKTKPGYFMPSRFNHLKSFISKEGQEIDWTNHLEHLVKGGDKNGR